MSAATGLRPRMMSPDLLLADDLEPGVRRLLFAGMMMSAEDSGCLPMPSPAALRATLVPYEDVTPAEVAQHVAALVEAGRVVPYEVAGRPYAFLPDFPRWNALTRWNAPRMAPLPSWITFTPDTNNANRRGAGTYTWGSPNADGPVEPNECKEDNELTNQLTNEPASSLGAGCEQAAEDSAEEGFNPWKALLAAYPKSPNGRAREAFDALPEPLQRRAYLAAGQRALEAEASGTELRYLKSLSNFLADTAELEVLADRRESELAAEEEREARRAQSSGALPAPPNSEEDWARGLENIARIKVELQGSEHP